MLRYIKQLAFESIVYGLSNIIARFSYIFLIPIYTRFLTPEEYGVFSLISVTITLISIFSALGLDNAAHRWYWDTEIVEERKVTLASWAWCQIAISLFFTILLFVFGDLIGYVIIHRGNTGIYFQLAAMAFLFSVLSNVFTNWLRMQRRPFTTMLFSVATSLSSILLNILFVATLHLGLTGIYIAQLLTAIVGMLIASVVLKDWVSPAKFRWVHLKKMLKFSYPMIPAAVFYWILNMSDRYFIQFFSSTSEVGLYQVGWSISFIVALITGAFQLAWGPFALSIHKQPEAKVVYSRVLLFYLWISCLISTALGIFAPELLRFLSTKDYTDASSVVGPLAFSHVFAGLTYIAVIGSTIVKTTAPYGIAVSISSGLTVVLYFFLVPQFGKEGAAFANLIGQAFIPAYVFYRSQKLYPIPYPFAPAFGILVLSLILMFLGQHILSESIFARIAIVVMQLFLTLLISFNSFMINLRQSIYK